MDKWELDAGELPRELTLPPTQLIGVSGLNVAQDPNHSAVFQVFTANRKPERLPLAFKVLDDQSSFPPVPSKRSDYDAVGPKGILKRDWMKKHLEDVPAVVVLFADLDWNHPSWAEKKTELQSKVESLRQSLERRNSRLAVVLLQAAAGLPAGEDVVAAERATELCLACDLSPKSLFVLPRTDQLFGYIIRLEQAFFELAQSYYQSEIRGIKTKKECLNRSSHVLLLVRLQFKLGFFSELRQESHTGLRHYKLAYQHLLESEAQYPTEKWLEWKTIAGFLNYKICSLCFQHNTPLDAIAQFRRHSEHCRAKIGAPKDVAELLHTTWLSKQFSSFGGLFEKAVSEGLAAIQTQHPGFYYQSAAQQLMARKVLVQKMWNSLAGIQYPLVEGVDPLAAPPKFFGQFPWRPEGESAAANEAMEQAGLLAVKLKESEKDMTGGTLQLLSAAMGQFKRYKSPRTRRFVMIQMGEEYMSLGDYPKALKLFSHAIWEYRQEGWWRLLEGILLQALQCVFALASVKEYVMLCLELLSPRIQLPSEEKTRIQGNLQNLLIGNIPQPEPGLPPAAVATGSEGWRKELGERVFFLVQMNDIKGMLEAEAWFLTPSVSGDEKIGVIVSLLLNAPFPMSFSELSVQFKPGTGEYENASTLSSPIQLKPGSLKLFQFTFSPKRDHVGYQIEIASISLSLGTIQSQVCGKLQWEGPFSPQTTSNLSSHATLETIPLASQLQITTRKAELAVRMEEKALILLDEKYPFKISICNTEKGRLRNLRLTVTVKKDEETEEEPVVLLMDGKEENQFTQTVPSLAVGESREVVIVMIAKDLGTFDLTCDVAYELDLNPSQEGEGILCSKKIPISVTTASAFAMTSTMLGNKMEAVSSLFVEEAALLSAELRVCSPSGLSIEQISWKLAPQFTPLDSITTPGPWDLWEGEACSFLLPFSPITPSLSPISCGEVLVSWKRRGADETLVVSRLPLPQTAVGVGVVGVGQVVPPLGTVRQLLNSVFSVQNKSPNSLRLSLNVQPSEAFMFSGTKQVDMRLLPNEVRSIPLVLFPLVAGNVALPRVKMTSPTVPDQVLDSIVQRACVNSIFIVVS